MGHIFTGIEDRTLRKWKWKEMELTFLNFCLGWYNYCPICPISIIYIIPLAILYGTTMGQK
ncbi:MAG: hypothetical protein A2W22_07035 [Candidatus Levybacteria bacterium RBG_16_35_11]|nr:MAG: hypothetical protein A2W22_07035 [Candidatus Levybacteria bacterium RBG_16_35_11]